MKSVSARFRGEHRLQSGGTAVLTRKGIDLNAGFANSFRLRGEIQNALANSAGHVEPVHNILIIIPALTIGAGVDLLFGGEIVHTRRGTSRPARSQAGSSWRHRHQRDQVATNDGQLRDRLILKSQLRAAIRSVDHRSLGRDADRLGNRADLQRDRHAQVLRGQQRNVDLRLGEAGRLHGNFVGTGSEAEESEIACLVGGGSLRGIRGDADQPHGGLSYARPGRILDGALHATGELGESAGGRKQNYEELDKVDDDFPAWFLPSWRLQHRGASRKRLLTNANVYILDCIRCQEHFRRLNRSVYLEMSIGTVFDPLGIVTVSERILTLDEPR